MELCTLITDFEILKDQIEGIYSDLHYTTSKILGLMKEEWINIPIIDPNDETFVIIENDKSPSFHEIIKDHNNKVFYSSILLAGYSIFEYSLKMVCGFIEDHTNPKFEFRNSGYSSNNEILKNCKKYIHDSKLLDLTQKKARVNDTFISLVNKYRNLIAHANGNLITDRSKKLELQKYYELFKKAKYLTILDNGQVFINSDEFIRRFNYGSEEYIKLIVAELEKSVSRPKCTT